MLKVQGKDFGNRLIDIQLKLVRTYKGEIKRTQTGKVAVFPVSFITVGFDLKFLGPRAEMKLLQQILLSDDLVEMTMTYDGTTIKGKFSCTTNEYTEVRDRGESSMMLTISVVSDGSDITNENGTLFTVYDADEAVVKANCAFGKIYAIGAYTLNGATLPEGKLLVLGDTTVVA